MSRPCHLSFDSRAKYVQISKVLTLRPLSPISFPWDQWGSLIADYLCGILWPIWHPHLLSAHRYTEVRSVSVERNVRIKHLRRIHPFFWLFDALCGCRESNKASHHQWLGWKWTEIQAIGLFTDITGSLNDALITAGDSWRCTKTYSYAMLFKTSKHTVKVTVLLSYT